MKADVLVIGSGIAGCSAALGAARAGASVVVATKARRPEETASYRAQGGIAVPRSDPDALKRDVLEASDATADEGAVDVLVENASGAVEDVLVDELAVPFDTDGGDYAYGREAAHSENRVLHVDASTGRHVHGRFLSHLDGVDRVRILEDTAALGLIERDGEVYGALLERDGEVHPAFAGSTVLATGGVGSIYHRSTNPDGATGDGIAMAALAGANVADVEYVQFHPTASAEDGSFLLSEAVRGEGALLRNGDGERFMPDYHPDAELAPRDVVARAVASERADTGNVVLDVSPFPFEDAFPDLASACERRGIDWRAGIPVAPSQHFLCGGIDVDDRGRTSLDRLFAVGECARTGVHGANRLASTSLLEGLVWGLRAGESATRNDPVEVEPPRLRDSDPSLPSEFVEEKFRRLRGITTEHLGVERTPEGVRRATAAIRRLKGEVESYVRTRTARDLYELHGATVTATLIARAAAGNDESVGCHYLREPAEVVTRDR